jgi:hypothetical protein
VCTAHLLAVAAELDSLKELGEARAGDLVQVLGVRVEGGSHEAGVVPPAALIQSLAMLQSLSNSLFVLLVLLVLLLILLLLLLLLCRVQCSGCAVAVLCGGLFSAHLALAVESSTLQCWQEVLASPLSSRRRFTNSITAVFSSTFFSLSPAWRPSRVPTMSGLGGCGRHW